MPVPTLTKLQFAEGLWTGRLSGTDEAEPALEITHLDRPVPGTRLTPDPAAPGNWRLEVPIPAAALSEGVQTILIRHGPSGTLLEHITIVTGAALEDDLRAELALLRAELDMLKKAFRRHCAEGEG
ncbi:hypothetical protein U879_16695 [Defluviimonas sp. 20V17]|uniref:Uncharacterized protein n=1 Tax=Allgaiera indica TaxID=765699 RepID=A0AAN4ZZM9_9RHOB|nr:hypothetical protein [Allgaiera indica]KDB02537.1 hypothetical protein U879_16695 [Defluviimonas sp. 20V17]GHE01601.1 hypothetical protein GCM10008024_17540 [Allgaiera indica]SDW98206.1 hypothetical protein SAMN05444006_108197 [Allgaiera indica]